MNETTAQQTTELARIRAALQAIWYMGDQDEQSTKHIRWATHAILNGWTWVNASEYGYPFPWNESNEWDADPHQDVKVEALAANWLKIQVVRAALGRDTFYQMLRDADELTGHLDVYINQWSNNCRKCWDCHPPLTLNESIARLANEGIEKEILDKLRPLIRAERTANSRRHRALAEFHHHADR